MKSRQFYHFSFCILQSLGTQRAQSRGIEPPGRVEWIDDMDKRDRCVESARKRIGKIERPQRTSRKIDRDQKPSRVNGGPGIPLLVSRVL